MLDLKARRELQRRTAALRGLQHRELASFEKASRLEAMLEEHGGTHTGPLTRGALSSSNEIRRALIAQQKSAREALTHLGTERGRIEAEIADLAHRSALLKARTEEEARSAVSIRDARTDEAASGGHRNVASNLHAPTENHRRHRSRP
ncbi:MAG: hypothetical protein AAFP13_13180 [Pseudomonadota bacterium]